MLSSVLALLAPLPTVCPSCQKTPGSRQQVPSVISTPAVSLPCQISVCLPGANTPPVCLCWMLLSDEHTVFFPRSCLILLTPQFFTYRFFSKMLPNSSHSLSCREHKEFVRWRKMSTPVLSLCYQERLGCLTPFSLRAGFYPESSLVPYANIFLSWLQL